MGHPLLGLPGWRTFLHRAWVWPLIKRLSGWQDAPLEWNKRWLNPVRTARHPCLHFCGQMDISWTGTLPAHGVAPGQGPFRIPVARGAQERVSYLRGARSALAAARPHAFSRHFSWDREFDCRMQNQLERLMELQEGNSKKK